MSRRVWLAFAGLAALVGMIEPALAPSGPSADPPAADPPVLLAFEKGRLKYYLPGLDGRTVHSEQTLGAWNLVFCWAPWCQPCREMLAWLPSFARNYKDRGVMLVLFAVDSDPESVRDYAAAHDLDVPCALVPTETATAWGGVENLPTLLLVDAEGRVVAKHEGWVSSRALTRTLERHRSSAPADRAGAGKRGRGSRGGAS